MEVLSALHSEGISGLPQSWKDVSKKSIENLDTLSDLMSPSKNFKNYR